MFVMAYLGNTLLGPSLACLWASIFEPLSHRPAERCSPSRTVCCQRRQPSLKKIRVQTDPRPPPPPETRPDPTSLTSATERDQFHGDQGSQGEAKRTRRGSGIVGVKVGLVFQRQVIAPIHLGGAEGRTEGETPLLIHDLDAFHEHASPILETGRPRGPAPDVTSSQQGGKDALEEADGSFGRKSLALLGLEPDDFAEAGHLGFELPNVFLAQRRLPVRVEHLHAFKGGVVGQHLHDDRAQTFPGLVLDGAHENGRGQPVDTCNRSGSG